MVARDLKFFYCNIDKFSKSREKIYYKKNPYHVHGMVWYGTEHLYSANSKDLLKGALQ